MSWLAKLGFQGSAAEQSSTESTATVRKIVAQLEAMPPDRARFVAALAYILSRVANADRVISHEETAAMEKIVRERGHLPPEQAVLVVEIAKGQNRLFGGTENFLVTRELREMIDEEQRHEILDCLFAVSAADDSISGVEEAQIRQIASELGIDHKQYVTARLPYSEKREVLKPLLDESNDGSGVE